MLVVVFLCHITARAVCLLPPDIARTQQQHMAISFSCSACSQKSSATKLTWFFALLLILATMIQVRAQPPTAGKCMPYPPSVCPVLHLTLGAVPRFVREVQHLRPLPIGLRLETGYGREIGGSTASFSPTDARGASVPWRRVEVGGAGDQCRA